MSKIETDFNTTLDFVQIKKKGNLDKYYTLSRQNSPENWRAVNVNRTAPSSMIDEDAEPMPSRFGLSEIAKSIDRSDFYSWGRTLWLSLSSLSRLQTKGQLLTNVPSKSCIGTPSC